MLSFQEIGGSSDNNINSPHTEKSSVSLQLARPDVFSRKIGDLTGMARRPSLA